MPRSSGTFTAPGSSWNPPINGSPATLVDWMVLLADLSYANTQALSRDGQSPALANLPMGGFKLIGMAAGTTAGDSLRFEQLAAVPVLTALASVNGGQLAGRRSRIINGNAAISERFGSSVTAIVAATRTYSVDRWIAYANAATTFQRNTFAGAEGDQLNYALLVYGVATLSNVQAMQRVESWNCLDMAGKAVTASIWVYQTTGTALTAGVVATRAGAVDDYTTSNVDNAFTVSVNGVVGTSIPNATWCKVTATTTLSTAAVTGLEIAFSLGGTITSGYCMFTKMQFELGSVATPFENASYGAELALCRRYCRVLPALITIGVTTMRTGGTAGYGVFIGGPMRTAPTMTCVGALPSVYVGDTPGLIASLGNVSVSADGSLSFVTPATGSAGQAGAVITGSTTTFSCEL